MTPRFEHTRMPAEHDGNTMMLLSSVTRMMRQADVPRKEIDEFARKVMSAESYDAALRLLATIVDMDDWCAFNDRDPRTMKVLS